MIDRASIYEKFEGDETSYKNDNLVNVVSASISKRDKGVVNALLIESEKRAKREGE